MRRRGRRFDEPALHMRRRTIADVHRERDRQVDCGANGPGGPGQAPTDGTNCEHVIASMDEALHGHRTPERHTVTPYSTEGKDQCLWYRLPGLYDRGQKHE